MTGADIVDLNIPVCDKLWALMRRPFFTRAETLMLACKFLADGLANVPRSRKVATALQAMFDHARGRLNAAKFRAAAKPLEAIKPYNVTDINVFWIARTILNACEKQSAAHVAQMAVSTALRAAADHAERRKARACGPAERLRASAKVRKAQAAFVTNVLMGDISATAATMAALATRKAKSAKAA